MDTPVSNTVETLIVRVTAVCELILVALTWKLWFCGSNFPRIPLLSPFVGLPDAAVTGISSLFAIATLVCVLSPPSTDSNTSRWIGVGTLALGALAVCCNQHCLQPWHWLFLLVILFRVLVPRDSVMAVWRILAATIYIFAALSRTGPKIDGGMSRQIVAVFLESFGATAVVDNAAAMTWLCVGLTAGELLTGCLLLTRQTHHIGMVAGIMMHGLLLVALGPFGLQQNTPVLIWNLFLAVWLLLLFRRNHSEHARTLTLNGRIAWLATGFCLIWPTLALVGLTDAWTGWQLYSPRPAVVHVEVRESSRRLIPLTGRHIADPAPLDQWQAIRIDRWCLEETGVPIYPAARFQLGVAAWLTRHFEFRAQADVRAQVDAPTIPFWWRRQTRELPDANSIREAAGGYLLNGRAVDSPAERKRRPQAVDADPERTF